MTQRQGSLLQGGDGKVHQTSFLGQESSCPLLPRAEEVRTSVLPWENSPL